MPGLPAISSSSNVIYRDAQKGEKGDSGERGYPGIQGPPGKLNFNLKFNFKTCVDLFNFLGLPGEINIRF